MCQPSIAIGYAGYGKRSAGYGPKCAEVKDRVCNKVPVKTPRYVEVPNCQNVPRTSCKEVTKNVVNTQCSPVEEQKCSQVPKQVSSKRFW